MDHSEFFTSLAELCEKHKVIIRATKPEVGVVVAFEKGNARVISRGDSSDNDFVGNLRKHAAVVTT